MKFQFTIRKKLILFSMLFIFSVIILGYLSNYVLEKSHKSMNMLIYEYLPVLTSFNYLKNLALNYRLNLDEYLFTGSNVYLQNMKNLKNEIDEKFYFLEEKNVREKEIMNELKNSFNSYFLLTESLITFYQYDPQNIESINIKKNKIDSLLSNAILSKIDLISKEEEARILGLIKEIENLHSSNIFLIFLLTAFLASSSIAYSFLISQSIVKPLKEIENATRKIAEGNFGLEVKVKTKDEFGVLANHFNEMSRKLLEFKEKIEAHQKELEKTVEERTKELNKKIKELTNTKIALTNMMEDLNETNIKLLKAQKELKKSFRELKKLDLEKDRFISIASHELKTPMTAILGFSQLLSIDKIAEDTETRHKYLNIIQSEIKRLNKLITNILDLSRIDLGTMKFTIVNIDLSQFMEEIRSEMEQRAREKNLILEFNLDKNLQNLKTDKEKLKEILINLIDNAIKYTEKGKIIVNAQKQNNFIKFSVSDTGIGIPKEAYKKLFTRFYQVESPLTRKVGGSGLGLSICKELVEALGGKIWFKSKVGKGTTFYFALPLKFKFKKQ